MSAMITKDDIRCRKTQSGSAILMAVFVLIVMTLLGAAMIRVVNLGEESVAREILSIRAFMAAESGIERGLRYVLEDGGSCTTPALTNLAWGGNPWQLTGLSYSGCQVEVSCMRIVVGGDNYYTIRAEGQCQGGAEPAFRVVEVQAQG